jgi:hypothetical protein
MKLISKFKTGSCLDFLKKGEKRNKAKHFPSKKSTLPRTGLSGEEPE